MRVLVAEDHSSLARSIASGLRDEGYAVDVSMHGDEALQWAMKENYDCIVLDIMMPGAGGWSILQSLRSSGRDVPVVCLTALDRVEDRVKGLNLGADDYLIKPFAFEELVARVASAVRRGHGKRSTRIVIGDLEIDTVKKSVARGGKNIVLTAREYALLEYLAHREGEVVSRSDIWDHLYDRNDDNTSNVVDVYIGYLRNKIDRDFPLKLIRTRRGQGYVLTAEPEESAQD